MDKPKITIVLSNTLAEGTVFSMKVPPEDGIVRVITPGRIKMLQGVDHKNARLMWTSEFAARDDADELRKEAWRQMGLNIVGDIIFFCVRDVYAHLVETVMIPCYDMAVTDMSRNLAFQYRDMQSKLIKCTATSYHCECFGYGAERYLPCIVIEGCSIMSVEDN